MTCVFLTRVRFKTKVLLLLTSQDQHVAPRSGKRRQWDYISCERTQSMLGREGRASFRNMLYTRPTLGARLFTAADKFQQQLHEALHFQITLSLHDSMTDSRRKKNCRLKFSRKLPVEQATPVFLKHFGAKQQEVWGQIVTFNAFCCKLVFLFALAPYGAVLTQSTVLSGLKWNIVNETIPKHTVVTLVCTNQHQIMN